MNRIHICLSFLLLIACLPAACRKEEPAQDDLFDTRSNSEIMYAIPLNGGAIEGRWTMNYEEYISFINDVQAGFDSTSHPNGAITLEFFSDGTIQHINQNDTTIGAYSVSGNQLTLNLSSTLHITSFGVENDKMHCQYSVTFTVGRDTYRDENEYLFSRY